MGATGGGAAGGGGGRVTKGSKAEVRKQGKGRGERGGVKC